MQLITCHRKVAIPYILYGSYYKYTQMTARSLSGNRYTGTDLILSPWHGQLVYQFVDAFLCPEVVFSEIIWPLSGPSLILLQPWCVSFCYPRHYRSTFVRCVFPCPRRYNRYTGRLRCVDRWKASKDFPIPVYSRNEDWDIIILKLHHPILNDQHVHVHHYPQKSSNKISSTYSHTLSAICMFSDNSPSGIVSSEAFSWEPFKAKDTVRGDI